jgi:hypothetical protein
MRIRGVIAAAVTVLAFAQTAQAVNLFTPALTVPMGDSTLQCHVVNVSTRDRDVTVKVIDFDGFEMRSVPMTVEVGRHRFVEAGVEVVGGVNRWPRYCKFVLEGSKTYYRTSACVHQPLVGCISTIAAE